jgi:RNA-binding protein
MDRAPTMGTAGGGCVRRNISQRETERNVELTSKQRAHLRALAHHLKPVVQIGKEGVTDASVRSAQEAFNTRELVKVKVQEAAPIPAREAAQELASRVDQATLVAAIGRTAILYRPDPEKPEIELPA